ncbi:MAG: SIMPL domain-containing protein [Bradyrhizobium sp.]|jgi:uncharacterized protein YggE
MMAVKHRAAIAAAVLAGTLLTAPAVAQTVPPPMISVTGQAEISVPPDQAQIEAGATSEAKNARDASEANNATMGKLLLALKAANIDEKDIQTSRLSLQAESAPSHPSGPPPIIGYRASNHVTVRLRDVTKAASTIDLLVGAGATDIGGINFIVSNASKLLDEARSEAIADARRKAEIYANAAGVTLGAPLSISEGGNLLPYRRMAVGMAAMAAASPVPVAQGEETLQVTVNVSWAIK